MNKDNFITAVVASVLVILGAVAFIGVGQDGRDGQNGKDGLGGFPGPDVYQHLFLNEGVTQGGAVVSTSTANATATLLNSDIVATNGKTTSLLKVTPTGAALTLTLPATSTLQHFIPNAGDTYTLVVENAATAATTTTIAAGAGMDLQEPDGQNVVIGQNNYARVTFLRDSTSDMVVTVDETIPAD